MMIIPIYLGNIGEAVRFVNNINTFEYECDLRCGSYYVDAKSLLGVINLHSSVNLELIIHADRADELVQSIEIYCG